MNKLEHEMTWSEGGLKSEKYWWDENVETGPEKNPKYPDIAYHTCLLSDTEIRTRDPNGDRERLDLSYTGMASCIRS